MSRRYSFQLIFLVLVFHFACAPPAPAQGEATQARKFDEFGDIQSSDLKARLDNFAIELQNQPTTRGFIMVYRSRRDLPGLNSRVASVMKDYLVKTRGLSAERVVTVDGGESAAGLVQEFWIVPAGAAPKPRADAYSQNLIDTESVRKFDEYYYSSPGNGGGEDDPEYFHYGDSLEAYAAALRQEPRALAYVIVYPQYYIERWEEGEEGKKSRTHTRVHLDGRGTAARVSRALRSELIGKYHIAASRIKFVNGGYRKQREIELWIVPRGERTPAATPNAFPSKLKQSRK